MTVRDRRRESDGRERNLERFYSLKRGAQQGEMALIKLFANEAFTHYAEIERGQGRKRGGSRKRDRGMN